MILACDVDHFDDSGAYPMRRRERRPARRHAVHRPVPGPAPRLAQHRRCTPTRCGRPRYRGPWMMETTAREQMLDVRGARRSGSTRSSFRRRNILHRAELPYTSPGGMVIDNVSPEETLEQAVAAIDYDAFRAEQAEAPPPRAATSASASRSTWSRRPASAPYANEPAHVRIAPRRPRRRVHRLRRARAGPRDDDRAARGRVPRRRTSTTSPCTRATPTATPFGPGTGGSRSGPMIGAGRHRRADPAAREGRRDRRAPARGGARRPRGRGGRRSRCKGTPTKSVTMAQVAQTAYQQSATLPPEVDPRARGRAPLHGARRHVVERVPRGHRRGRPRTPARSRSSASWCARTAAA